MNDVHGHPCGDELLRQAAAAWGRELRTEDILARTGGDEFTLLLADCPLREASRVIERLQAATPAGHTCSVGLVHWDRCEAGEELATRADRALYAAKRAGRNHLVAT